MTEEPINQVVDTSYLQDAKRLLDNYEVGREIKITENIVPGAEDKFSYELKGSFLTVNATNKRLLSVGIYKWLESLGFRFYGPEDHWTYMPDKITLRNTYKEFPVRFRLTRYASSGGFGHPNKSTRSAGRLWSRWMNRIGTYNLDRLPWGHYGAKFNVKYKEQIKAHPEWRAEQGGTRLNWNKNVKLCYSNREVQELLIKDAISRLKAVKSKEKRESYFINVEPPDGGNFCNCHLCKGMTTSDKVFGMANTIAKRIRQVDNNANVFLLAYNTHAAPPSFSLEDNVFVGIVTQAFQNYGTQEEMMDDWSKKTNNIFFRGYLSIPIWNKDRPYWGNLDKNVELLNNLLNRNFYGFNFESTSSFMSAGLNHYMMQQAVFNTGLDLEVEINEFYEKMFHENPGKVKEIISFLNNSSTENYHLDDAYAVISQIKNQATESNEKKRYDDILLYIDYLSYYYKFQRTKEKEDLKSLLDIVMSDNEHTVLSSWSLFKVLQKGRKDKVPFQNRVGMIANRRSNLREPEAIPKDLFRKKEYAISNPRFKSISRSDRSLRIRNSYSAIFYVDSPGEYSFTLKTISNNSGLGKASIILNNADGNEIEKQEITVDGKFHTYTFLIRESGFYSIDYNRKRSEMYLKYPRFPFAFTSPVSNFNNTGIETFYTLPKENKLVLVNPKNNKKLQLLQNGKQLSARKLENGTVEVDCRPNQIVTINTSKAGVKILNQKHILSIYPEAYFYEKE